MGTFSLLSTAQCHSAADAGVVGPPLLGSFHRGGAAHLVGAMQATSSASTTFFLLNLQHQTPFDR